MLKLGTALTALVLGQGLAAQASRTVLPVPAAPFDGTIGETIAQSKPARLQPVRAPQGAPNVLVLMSDDVGFSMASTFGGPVPTPNMDRLAAQGQRYNRFHTTGVCSPSRAALLTGRNHHQTGVGYLSDLPVGFPGYTGRILPETASIAQVLRLNGYNTAMFGKHHNMPSTDRSEAGPFDAWPTGLGFEYFFGFVHGDVDQYSPILHRGTSRVDQREGKGDLLDKRFADDIIRYVHNQNAAAPDKPFFVYWAPGSTHAPHQAPAEYIARFKGRFDQGWDKLREETYRRQIDQGIIPKGTKLTPRPAEIPAWASLSPAQKAFAARSMEVAAAQMVYQDEQIGRVIDELERMGLAGNTLVSIIQGDNGASGEAGPPGTINELRGIITHDEREDWMLANTEKLGSADTYGSYPVGWAWAMNTPLRWVKQMPSMLGGIRNGMVLSWPGKVKQPGSVCAQFSHLVDIAPTVLEAAKLPAPETVYGVRQKAMDGQSLVGSLSSCEAGKPRTQYFEIGGKIGLYHDGWFLSGDDGRPSWKEESTPAPVKWSLYNLEKDFAQATDLATKEPERLAEMLALWKREAERNNVLPIDTRRAMDRSDRVASGASRKNYVYWGKDVSMPAVGSAPFLGARRFTISADLRLDKAEASGVVLAWGSKFGGLSLYLDGGRPAFAWAKSTDPREMATLRAEGRLPQGGAKLTLRYEPKAGADSATVILSANGSEIARGDMPTRIVTPAGNGETMDIGRDLGVPVTAYATPFGEIEGDIPRLAIDFD
ncbi:arylsulfatase [Novosphingobium sp. TH158]|nr:arylsulfatase [Novosphingobium sp. TH158]